jgi:hypothetical protein
MRRFAHSLPLLLCLLVLFCFSLPAVADPLPVTLSIQPSYSSVAAGNLFQVSVNISPVTNFFAFQFNISFDPAILSAVSVTEGTFLPSTGNFFSGFDDGFGTISYVADALNGPAGITGQGTLAILQFRALGPGASGINLSDIILLNADQADIPFNISNGTVNVEASVPEPGVLLLLSLGLIAVAFATSRLKRA